MGAPAPAPAPKNLLRSDALFQYILNTSVLPREHELLRELREATERVPQQIPQTDGLARPYLTKDVRQILLPPDEGQLLSLLLKMTKAKKTLEIGVFTGYSLLTTALAIPKDGKITAIDIDNHNLENIGWPLIKRAGVENKINFIHSPALPVLDKLVEEVTKEEEDLYDFAFIDADKMGYGAYHERVMKLVKVGGVIVYDNILWRGTVAEPDLSPTPLDRELAEYLIKFNQYLADDKRIDLSLVCIGDGLTICIRLY